MFQGKGFVSRFSRSIPIIFSVILIFSQTKLSAQMFAPTMSLSDESNASDPRIAIDSHGNVDFAWLDESAGTPAVFFSRFSNKGHTFSAPLNVSEHPGSPAEGVRIIVDSAGKIYVVWRETNSGTRTVFFSCSSDQGATFSRPASVSTIKTDGDAPPKGPAASGGTAVSLSNGNSAAASAAPPIISDQATSRKFAAGTNPMSLPARAVVPASSIGETAHATPNALVFRTPATVSGSSDQPRTVPLGPTTSAINGIEYVDCLHYSCSDIGDGIRAAYAALPATGGIINLPPGTYNLSAITFDTSCKPAMVVGSGSRSTVLKYTGNEAAFTFDNGCDTDAYGTMGTGLGQLSLFGPGGPRGTGNSGIGVSIGGANGGWGFTTTDVLISGFTTGYVYAGDTPASWGFHNILLRLVNNTTDLSIVPTGVGVENAYFNHSMFANTTGSSDWNAKGVVLGGGAMVHFESCSFDGDQVVIESTGGQYSFASPHFEPTPRAESSSTVPITIAGGQISFTNAELWYTPTSGSSVPAEYIKLIDGQLSINGLFADTNQVIRTLIDAEPGTSVENLNVRSVSGFSKIVTSLGSTVQTLGNGDLALSGSLTTGAFTVSGLPSASSVSPGSQVVVTDAASFAPGTCTGGGSDYMIAVSNGSTWSCH